MLVRALQSRFGKAGATLLWWTWGGVTAVMALLRPIPHPHLLYPPNWPVALLWLMWLAAGLILSVPRRRLTLAGGALGLILIFPAGIFLVILPVLREWVHPNPSRTVLGRPAWFFPPLTLSADDRLLHLHVLGPTGSGKSSSVLLPLIVQDLQQGHGVFVLEPKGDLSGAVYRAARKWGRPVMVLDPLNPSAPHYNPLSGPGDAAAEGLSWALNQIQEAGHPFYAVTSRVLLLHSVIALKSVLGEGADLSHLIQFLRQPGYQREILVHDACDSAAARYFAEQIGRQKAQHAHEQQIGLLNRLELLMVNPSVRRMLTGNGDFTWDMVFQDDWTVIAPISPATLGESARVLGTLLWHGLSMATYRRKLPADRPFFFYLDEFHQYVTPDLSEYLALARGFGVGLILAHQYMGQLTPALAEAVSANARQRVALGGLAPKDTDWLAAAARPHPLPAAPRYLKRGWAVAQTTQNSTLKRPRLIRLRHLPLGADRG